MKNDSYIKVESAIHEILKYIGEDISREGLLKTPERMIKSWDELFSGYNKSPKDVVTVFENEAGPQKSQIILLKDIEFYSTCEHHFLPFLGKAHVAYIPNDKIIGVSKLARIVEVFSRRLQVQERIGNQVTDSLMELLNPLAAACIIECKHLCMACRGVQKQNSIMVTSSLRGDFMDDHKTRLELMTLIKS